MKRRRVRWSEPASLDLIEVIEFVQRDRTSAARKLAQDLLAAASRLRLQPLTGKVVPELLEQGISDHRQLLVGPYRLIYTVRESIDIVAVMDSRRDLQTALFQRLLR